MTLGPIAFLSPWLLAGLLALPVIWWLLRTIPPRPRRIAFPPTRILVGIENRQKTPAKTPWWLTLLRMAAAALLILALAEPVLNPNREAALAGSGPVVLVVDNGWAAAAHWSSRTFMIERLIAEAEAQSRPVMIVPTANATKSVSLKVEAPTAARSTAAAVQPQPFAPDRLATARAIAAALSSGAGASVVWLSDGIDHDDTARQFAEQLKAPPRPGWRWSRRTPGMRRWAPAPPSSAAAAWRRRCCGPTPERRAAGCSMPCRGAASGWDRLPTRSRSARRARWRASSCRWSFGTR
jgi:hypothetical protein